MPPSTSRTCSSSRSNAASHGSLRNHHSFDYNHDQERTDIHSFDNLRSNTVTSATLDSYPFISDLPDTLLLDFDIQTSQDSFHPPTTVLDDFQQYDSIYADTLPSSFPDFETNALDSSNDAMDFSLFEFNDQPVSTDSPTSAQNYPFQQSFATLFQPCASDISNETPLINDQTIVQISSDPSTSPRPSPPTLSSTSVSRSATSTDGGGSRPRSPVLRSRVEKRQANTVAARRYRQKRQDHVAELEAALKAMQDERDSLRVRVGELEGETRVLNGLVSGS